MRSKTETNKETKMGRMLNFKCELFIDIKNIKNKVRMSKSRNVFCI